MAHDALGATAHGMSSACPKLSARARAGRPDVGRHVCRGCGVATADRARLTGATAGGGGGGHFIGVSHRARCPVGAYQGGAPVLKASVRVAFWGALAMGITAMVGRLFGSGGVNPAVSHS